MGLTRTTMIKLVCQFTTAVVLMCGAVVTCQTTAASRIHIEDTIRIYCEAWSEPSVEKRRQLLQRVWTEDGTYTDPMSHVVGRESLIHHISEHLAKNPGSEIVPSSLTDLHHGLLRFSWRFVGADGNVRMQGVDFGELAVDGRLKRIVGFFDPPEGR